MPRALLGAGGWLTALVRPDDTDKQADISTRHKRSRCVCQLRLCVAFSAPLHLLTTITVRQSHTLPTASPFPPKTNKQTHHPRWIRDNIDAVQLLQQPRLVALALLNLLCVVVVGWVWQASSR